MPLFQYLPFGGWTPDAGAFSNAGLRRCYGVIPLAGGHIVSPGVELIGSGFGSAGVGSNPVGFHVHTAQDSTLAPLSYGYYGQYSRLYEIDLGAGTTTDRSRAGNYNLTAAGSPAPYWNFLTYGDFVVATCYADEIQYQASPGSGNFADLITSTFAPRCRYLMTVRQNLFALSCGVDTAYAGISVGDHGQLVAWSQNDNIRAFGSESEDPQLIGADYQFLNNDLGPITGGVGGDFGIIFQRKGHVRVDGPPYTFRSIPEGGCLQPESIIRIGNDVYFWGLRGPSVLRNGEAPVEVLGDPGVVRSLTDSVTGFSEVAASLDFSGTGSQVIRRVQVTADTINGIIRWSFYPSGGQVCTSDSVADCISLALPTIYGSVFLDYNYQDGRFAVSPVRISGVDGSGNRDTVGYILGLGETSPDDTGTWSPYLASYGVIEEFDNASPAITRYPFRFSLDADLKADVKFLTPLIRISGSDTNPTTSKITAVRPVYRVRPTATLPTVSVNIRVASRPFEDEVAYGPFTTQDPDGWIATPDSTFAHYQAIELVIDPDDTGDGKDIFEIEGVEIEYAEGGTVGT